MFTCATSEAPRTGKCAVYITPRCRYVGTLNIVWTELLLARHQERRGRADRGAAGGERERVAAEDGHGDARRDMRQAGAADRGDDLLGEDRQHEGGRVHRRAVVPGLGLGSGLGSGLETC